MPAFWLGNIQPGTSAPLIELCEVGIITWSSLRSHSASEPLQAVISWGAEEVADERRTSQTAPASEQHDREPADQCDGPAARRISLSFGARTRLRLDTRQQVEGG